MTADQLRRVIEALPALTSRDIWSRHRESLRWHILNSSPENFLEWSTIRATMYVGNAPWLPVEFRELSIRLLGITGTAGYGCSIYADCDTNLIHQAYHLSQWERVTGKRVENLSKIIEFGGGYGAMCLLCKRLGFKGKYWLEDLPELSALQAYYLDSNRSNQGVYFGSPYRYSCDLFIAIHSLCEISLPEREQVLRGLDANSFLFVFHCEHDHIDNLEWFSQLMESRPEYDWHQWMPEHLPNTRYQIGIKNE